MDDREDKIEGRLPYGGWASGRGKMPIWGWVIVAAIVLAVLFWRIAR